MFNEHDLQEIHRDAARSMPRFERASTTTANPTKMNVIVPIIPEPTREIMDLTLLAIGAELNILLCLAIASSPSMRTSVNCYVASLACANLAILLEPLQQALRWIFDVDLRMNLDYVFLVTFYASALTMILIHVETYVVVCQKSSYLREPLVRVSTAAKGLLFVWTCCVTLTAMELHMYDHVDRTVTYDICVSSTIMFLIFPCCVFVLLDYFVLYDLTVSKSIDGKWPDEDTERFLLSGERVPTNGGIPGDSRTEIYVTFVCLQPASLLDLF